MSEMSIRAERGERRLTQSLWGTRDDAIYLRRLAREMRAYEDRRQGDAGALRGGAESLDTALS